MRNTVKKTYFVTGTDTGSGKTWSSVAFMQALKKSGYKTCGMKPVATGGKREGTNLFSEDAILLSKHASISLPYEYVNPICLESAASPNIALDIERRQFSQEQILQTYNKILGMADRVVVEGIGGWRTPCSSSLSLASMVKEMEASVILVVGLRLGCINHAHLTLESIISDGVKFSGWIANTIDPSYSYKAKTLEYLKANIKAPLLGLIPHIRQDIPEDLGEYIQPPTKF